MYLPISDKEFDTIVTQLWKGRKSEPIVNELYEKLKLIQESKDE